MSTDMVKISVGLRFAPDGESHEVEHLVGFPRKEWEPMTEAQRKAKLDELAKALVDSYVTSWATPLEDR